MKCEKTQNHAKPFEDSKILYPERVMEESPDKRLGSKEESD